MSKIAFPKSTPKVVLHHRDAEVRILSDNVGRLNAADANELVKRIGQISKQSDEFTKKDGLGFVHMFYDICHRAALEASWATVRFLECDPVERAGLEAGMRKYSNLFCITSDKGGITVSGDAMVWMAAGMREYVGGYQCHVLPALTVLSRWNPDLYSSPPGGWGPTYAWSKDRVVLNPPVSGMSPREQLVHRYVAMIFDNVSRGFTHELVRHRPGYDELVAFMQESTRYVMLATGKRKREFHAIVPYGVKDMDLDAEITICVGTAVMTITVRDAFEIYKEIYSGCIDQLGWKAQDARQLLPIGIKAQI